MRFSNQNLPERLAQDLTHFLRKNDFAELYKSYSWQNDTFQNGFPDILKLEAQLTESDRNEGISLDDVRDVASWGKLRNLNRSSCLVKYSCVILTGWQPMRSDFDTTDSNQLQDCFYSSPGLIG